MPRLPLPASPTHPSSLSSLPGPSSLLLPRSRALQDVRVVDAVLASMAIPMVFQPSRILEEAAVGSKPKPSRTFVDGGLVANFPLQAVSDCTVRVSCVLVCVSVVLGRVLLPDP